MFGGQRGGIGRPKYGRYSTQYQTGYRPARPIYLDDRLRGMGLGPSRRQCPPLPGTMNGPFRGGLYPGFRSGGCGPRLPRYGGRYPECSGIFEDEWRCGVGSGGGYGGGYGGGGWLRGGGLGGGYYGGSYDEDFDYYGGGGGYGGRYEQDDSFYDLDPYQNYSTGGYSY